MKKKAKKIKKTHRKPKTHRKKAIKRKKPTKRVKPKKRVIRKRKIVRRKRVKVSKPKIYIGKGILEQLFESQAKVKLMKFFFRNAEEMFQFKDILKKLRSSSSALRLEMKKLEKADLIKEKRVWLAFPKKRGGVRKAKKTVYCLNLNFEFFKELKDLILKSTISSKEDLVNDVKKLGNIKVFVLSGVFQGADSSKADLLIVGDKINQRKFSTFLKDLEAEVGKGLNCALMSGKEFNYRYDMYDRFVRDLITENSEVLINKLNLW